MSNIVSESAKEMEFKMYSKKILNVVVVKQDKVELPWSPTLEMLRKCSFVARKEMRLTFEMCVI